jgi:hypothetical protein
VSLTIQRFVTRCRASPAPAVRRAALEGVVRKEFAAECARRLEGSRLRGLVRLRDLRLRVKISREDFSAGRLPAIWAETFAAELARMTASGGEGVVRAENRVAWSATFIGDLLAGRARQRWEYAEFRELFELDLSHAILRLLGKRPEETGAVLELLARRGDLPRLLTAFEETTLESLFALVAQGLESVPAALELGDLILVARLVIADPESRAASILATRRRALRLWGEGFSSLNEQSATARVRTPGDMFALLKCLDWLRAELASKARAPAEHALDRLAIAQRAGEPLRQVLESFSSGPGGESPEILELRKVMNEPPLLSDPGLSLSSPWLDSNAAGLLLLIGIIERLGWRGRARPSLHAMGGDNAETAFFAALGLAALGRSFEARVRLDPAVAILAGRPEDAAAFEVSQFLEDGASEQRRALLLTLLGDLAETPAEESWEATIELLAAHLIRAFAQRLRGFGEARRAFLVKQFLAIPGRIQIEEHRIQVVLAPQPLHVVLRLAAMDATLETVTWLGGRRTEFYLEGL